MDTLPSRIVGAVQFIARSESRFPARLRARLQCDGEPEIAVALGNVSPSGFMAVAPAPVQAGSRVKLVLPVGSPVEADVIWSLNGQFGCRVDGGFSRGQMAVLIALSALRGLPTAAGARAAVVLFLIGFLIFND